MIIVFDKERMEDGKITFNYPELKLKPDELESFLDALYKLNTFPLVIRTKSIYVILILMKITKKYGKARAELIMPKQDDMIIIGNNGRIEKGGVYYDEFFQNYFDMPTPDLDSIF